MRQMIPAGVNPADVPNCTLVLVNWQEAHSNDILQDIEDYYGPIALILKCSGGPDVMRGCDRYDALVVIAPVNYAGTDRLTNFKLAFAKMESFMFEFPDQPFSIVIHCNGSFHRGPVGAYAMAHYFAHVSYERFFTVLSDVRYIWAGHMDRIAHRLDVTALSSKELKLIAACDWVEEALGRRAFVPRAPPPPPIDLGLPRNSAAAPAPLAAVAVVAKRRPVVRGSVAPLVAAPLPPAGEPPASPLGPRPPAGPPPGYAPGDLASSSSRSAGAAGHADSGAAPSQVVGMDAHLRASASEPAPAKAPPAPPPAPARPPSVPDIPSQRLRDFLGLLGNVPPAPDQEGWTALHHCVERSSPAFGDRAVEMQGILVDSLVHNGRTGRILINISGVRRWAVLPRTLQL